MKGLRKCLILVLLVGVLAAGCATRLSSDGIEIILSPVGPYYIAPYWYWNGSFYTYRGGRYHFHHHAPSHQR
jgi:hypothetical protein